MASLSYIMNLEKAWEEKRKEKRKGDLPQSAGGENSQLSEDLDGVPKMTAGAVTANEKG